MKVNDHVEFESDRLTDKGPCSGVVERIEEVGGHRKYLCAISDGREWFTANDLLDNLVRVGTHFRTNRPLWIFA